MSKAALKGIVISTAIGFVVGGCAQMSPDPVGSYAGASGAVGTFGFQQITGVGGNVASNAGTVAVFGGAAGTAGLSTGVSGKGSGGIGVAGGKAGSTTTTQPAGSGGSLTNGGKGGSLTGSSGGKAGTGTGGSAGSTASIFPKSYNSSCAPFQKVHEAGNSCMSGRCHSNFLAAGTVYKTGGTTGASNIEVGIKSGSNFLYACSDSGGNFIFRSGSNVQWANAEISIRSANGEKKKINPVNNGDCNASGCHDRQLRLIAP